MGKALTLSLIIPVYSEERHLKKCLDSVAAQTVMPDEVIVVDNNSTDRSVEIARSYDFVQVIHEKEQGIAHARNAGFDAASGTILCRIDADTVLPADWTEYIQGYYGDPAHSDVALTGGGYFYNIRLPRLNGWLQSQLAFRTNKLISGHHILWGSNMALPAHIWKKIRTEACIDRAVHEDVDLAIHVTKAGHVIDYHPSFQVGVFLKRVWSDRNKLHEHARRWPTTFKRHHYKLWWVGLIGNVFLFYVVQPTFFIIELIARLSGKRSIQPE